LRGKKKREIVIAPYQVDKGGERRSTSIGYGGCGNAVRIIGHQVGGGFIYPRISTKRWVQNTKRVEDPPNILNVDLDPLLVILGVWHGCSSHLKSVLDVTHNPEVVRYRRQERPRLINVHFQILHRNPHGLVEVT
jgi:hypothetical protein